MSETPAVYHLDTTPLGYMPLPEVYSALDFALSLARSQSPAAGAATAFLTSWLQAGPMPSKEAIADLRIAMAEQIAAITNAFDATMHAFVDQLADHPSPMPGSPFGDYYADLVQLQAAGSDS